MWRWLSGLPRAIRQQIHGPRAATGICLEEEAELEQQYQDVKRKKCIFEKNHVGFFTCTFGFDGEDKSKQGPDQDKWYKNYSKDFCSFINGNHNALEALGWGAAVVLGIHLSKCPKQHKEKHKHRRHIDGQKRCVLYQVALAIPDKARGSGRNVAHSIVGSNVRINSRLPEENNAINYESKTQEDVKKIHDPLAKEETESQQDPLHRVMNEFEDMCRKYTGIGKNVEGLQAVAKHHMKKAVNSFIDASHLGYTKAQFNLGLCYETGKGVKIDLRKAEKYYKLAAEDGHSQAMYNLALMYLKGEGGIEKNVMLALDLLHKAAEIGLGQAQTYLGVHYTDEESQDLEKAVSFFKAAADQNDAEAQYFLGLCYEQGLGIEVNECKSAELYTQAASSGHDGAMYNLGVFHELALGGLPEDKVSAVNMYQKAAERGNEQAMLQLNRLKADAVREDLQLLQREQETEILKQEKEEEIQEIQDKQSIKLNISMSSPSLTDYVRNHLTLFITASTTMPFSVQDPLTMLKNQLYDVDPLTGIANLGSNGEITPDAGLPALVTQMEDWNPQFGSPRRSTERVSFSLGGDEDDIEQLLSLEDGVPKQPSPQIHHYCSFITKNSTMPNLNCVSCK